MDSIVKDPVYVTGHQNPDTDSIVAAMAYAALRNAVGDREYEAACLGRVSDETEMVLKKFGFQPPKRINNMYTQVRDLDFDTPPILSTAVTEGGRLSSAWDASTWRIHRERWMSWQTLSAMRQSQARSFWMPPCSYWGMARQALMKVSCTASSTTGSI